MSEFQIEHCRYKNGENRIKTEFINAPDFLGAIIRAQDMCRGMTDADPDAVFSVTTISTRGIHGHHTVSGWMTQEEFTAHVAAKNAKGS